MFYPGIQETQFSTFNGAILTLGEYSVPQTNGLTARNCKYLHGQVGTRYGHSLVVAQTDGQITDIVNWYFFTAGAAASVLLYYAPSVGVKGWQQGGGGFTGTFMAVTGAAGSVMVPAGSRLYAAFYGTTGQVGTADGGMVYGWNIGADTLCAAPLSNAIAASEPSTGVVTAGTRNIAYLTTTRNGFTGNLSPVVTGDFTPLQYTTSGGKNLVLSISGSLPAYMVGGTIQIVMTTAANNQRYFTVPGATNLATNPTNITVDISDADLAAFGTDVTDFMDLIAAGTSSPAFRPSAIFTYGNRMGYVTLDPLGFPIVLISDQNDYQKLSYALNVVTVPGLQNVVQCFDLRGVLYMFTPFGCWAVQDNGNSPSTWLAAQKVDGALGILAPDCIGVNSALGYAGIATERGLYIFQGGAFPALPISYYQDTDWSRINWAVPTKVKVIDDQLNKRFMVIAPLDSATAPSHIMTWDYTEGDTPEQVKYSLDNIDSYAIGAFGVIQNLTTKLKEVWYAPNVTGAFIRQNNGHETNPYRDLATNGTTVTAITCVYRTSIAPGPEDTSSTVHDFHGCHLDMNGNGTVAMIAYGKNGATNEVPLQSPIAISAAPIEEYLVKWCLRSEQQSIQFTSSTIDYHFTLSMVRVYWTPSFAQR